MPPRSTGFWDEDEGGAGATATTRVNPRRKPAVPAPVVKDDWDDDDDDEDDDVAGEDPVVVEERNKRIWEDANTKPHHAMPEVVVSRGAGSSAGAVSATAQGVFDQLPKMKILKRPTAQAAASSVPAGGSEGGAGAAQETLREREARYNAARERIFGGSESPAGEAASSTSGRARASAGGKGGGGQGQQQQAVKLAREPKGPSARDAAGFGSRGGGGGGKANRKHGSDSAQ